MEYELLKWLHIVSSTVLFGTGMGTAFHGFFGSLRGDVTTNATVWRNVVFADWVFTTPSVIVQPLSGFALVWWVGYGWGESWLVVTYALYALAGACWLPVVAIQIKLARIAEQAVADDTPLPATFFRQRTIWFVLGWPAFSALIGVFYLMVAKPDFW